ncbi:hypothetical protein B4168_2538 [Anoxybacillus flavithermus]|nr:hypothetical protein B4168_2538 [Anoxybacillus flavithermus]OAO85242.1 hypothetical protein GT23_2933 [Parageobacillus thermoglucosidasius]
MPEIPYVTGRPLMPKKYLKFYSSYPLIQVMADWNEGVI